MKNSPYQDYKNVDTDWMKTIPSHWEMKPLRALLKERKEKNDPIKTTQILSLSIARGVTLYSDKGRGGNKAKNDLSAYKIAHPNDIVLNSMNVIVGAVGLSRFKGAISPVYYALFSRCEDVNIHYYEKIFSNHIFQRNLSIYGKGILIKKSDAGKLNTIRMKISMSDLKKVALPYPPLSEQKQIVRFLEYKCAQINKFIQKKKRLIEQLKEQKQVIINQVVTRGLDPNVRLKPSGIEWLGDIPEHWEAFPIKRLFSLIKYGTSESAGDKGKYKILTMGHIQDGKIVAKNCGLLKDLEDELLLRYNDLLFNRTNSKELVGKVGIFKEHTGDYSFASYLVLLRVNGKSLPDYINYLLNSSLFITYVRRHSIPSLNQSNLNPTRYSRFPVPLPPLEEQNRILEHIETSCSNINLLISSSQQQIDLIQEYRTRLISDVMTGQIDVRDIEISDIIEGELIEETIEEEQEEESLELVGAGNDD